MRAVSGRWLRSLRDRVFPWRASEAEHARAPEHDRVCDPIAFAEIVAAATVLDFGGLPVESCIWSRRIIDRSEGAD